MLLNAWNAQGTFNECRNGLIIVLDCYSVRITYAAADHVVDKNHVSALVQGRSHAISRMSQGNHNFEERKSKHDFVEEPSFSCYIAGNNQLSNADRLVAMWTSEESLNCLNYHTTMTIMDSFEGIFKEQQVHNISCLKCIILWNETGGINRKWKRRPRLQGISSLTNHELKFTHYWWIIYQLSLKRGEEGPSQEMTRINNRDTFVISTWMLISWLERHIIGLGLMLRRKSIPVCCGKQAMRDVSQIPVPSSGAGALLWVSWYSCRASYRVQYEISMEPECSWDVFIIYNGLGAIQELPKSRNATSEALKNKSLL